ncbi:MAG: hypothetical protein PHR16_17385 [Methylovulum sp.]|nr:hypothetical protein [Methylovulum sp.]
MRASSDIATSYALCVHTLRGINDWSQLSYKHLNKTDTYATSAPCGCHARNRYGIWPAIQPDCQRPDGVAAGTGGTAAGQRRWELRHLRRYDIPAKHHLEEVSDCIRHLDSQGFPRPLVHLIGREGGSVGHIRRWDAAGSRWLVRVKNNPKTDYVGKPTACKTEEGGLPQA